MYLNFQYGARVSFGFRVTAAAAISVAMKKSHADLRFSEILQMSNLPRYGVSASLRRSSKHGCIPDILISDEECLVDCLQSFHVDSEVQIDVVRY